MKELSSFINKNLTNIMTFVSSLGVIGTAVLAVKATPKAMLLIEEAEDRKKEEAFIKCRTHGFDEVSEDSLRLTTADIVRVAWKPYIPAFLMGFSTIVCIVGTNYLNKRTQQSIAASYALLDRAFKEYRKNLKENNPELYDEMQKMALQTKYNNTKNNIKATNETKQDKILFYDMNSMRYFYSTFEELREAENKLNIRISKTGYACLNDIYDYLNLDRVPYGYQIGWCLESSDDYYFNEPVHFVTNKCVMDDGLECITVELSSPEEMQYGLND